MRGGRSQILYQYQFRDAFSDGVGQTAQFPIAKGTVQGLRLFVEVAHHQRNASGSLHTGHGFELREQKMPAARGQVRRRRADKGYNHKKRPGSRP